MEGMCRTVRRDILTMIHAAGSGHPGGSLSAVELLVGLYFSGLFRADPTAPEAPDRDRFILSKGHCAPVLYSVLCRRGYFDPVHLGSLRKLGSMLQGHPHAPLVPGLDTSAGSLGQGLSVANGIALGYRLRGSPGRVYCLLGDGELQEGQVWEAALTAAQLQLGRVCAIVDNNHVQLDGPTASIKNVEPVAQKWRSFGWRTIEIDGHDIEAVVEAYRSAMEKEDQPTVVVAETVKGKGVSFMEGEAAWHGQAPGDEQLEAALREIGETR